MKSDAGVGAVQCWSVPATVRAAQWQVWAYAVGVLAGYRAWGYDRHPAALRPPGLWWRGAARWSIATLWRGYRQALDLPPAFSPVAREHGAPGPKLRPRCSIWTPSWP